MEATGSGESATRNRGSRATTSFTSESPVALACPGGDWHVGPPLAHARGSVMGRVAEKWRWTIRWATKIATVEVGPAYPWLAQRGRMLASQTKRFSTS